MVVNNEPKVESWVLSKACRISDTGVGILGWNLIWATGDDQLPSSHP